MGYYEYAKNDIDKWKVLLGFKVIHFNNLLGIGIISDVYSQKGNIFLKIKFAENRYDNYLEKTFLNYILENYCEIENLQSIEGLKQYYEGNSNKKLDNKKKEDYFKLLSEKRIKDYSRVDIYDCVNDKELLNDNIYVNEVENLVYTLNILSDEIKYIKSKISIYDSDSNYYYSPTAEERIEMGRIRSERRLLYKNEEEVINKYEKPYFARLTIESVNNKIYDYYVGEKDIYDNNKAIVYDWRSKLGQRYYRRNELRFNLENIEYHVNLIRKLDIRKSILENYYNEYTRDNELAFNKIKEANNIISDPFLIEILKEKRNISELTNIISTIQENQNSIITQNINNNFIVQGCAGSGKTMILLHRLSFLLYNNNKLSLDKIKIITPNNLFKMTIGNLARELQIDQIEKLCIEEYMDSKVKEYGLEITEEIVNSNISDELYEYIYSEKFIQLLKDNYEVYLNELRNRFKLQKIDILADAHKINHGKVDSLSLDELNYITRRVIEESPKKLKECNEIELEIRRLNEKIKDNKKYQQKLKLLLELRNSQKEISWFYFNRQKEFKREIEKVLQSIKLDKSSSLKDLINKKIEAIESSAELQKEKNDQVKKIAEYKSKYFFDKDPEDLIKGIDDFKKITDDNTDFLESKIYNPLIKEISEKYNYKEYKLKTKERIYSLLNLLYIHKGPLNKKDRMIYFDEGQDINYFEYSIINNINNKSLIMNVFGDVNQLINKRRGINNWNQLSTIIDFNIFYLNENYRNSKAVTKYCINETGYNMMPIGVESGIVISLKDNEHEIKELVDLFIKDIGLRKVIIVKEIDIEVKAFLGNYFSGQSINIIYDNSNGIKVDKINVIDIKNVKGMEFDSTLAFTKNMNNNELYICLSRALCNSYIIN